MSEQIEIVKWKRMKFYGTIIRVILWNSNLWIKLLDIGTMIDHSDIWKLFNGHRDELEPLSVYKKFTDTSSVKSARGRSAIWIRKEGVYIILSHSETPKAKLFRRNIGRLFDKVEKSLGIEFNQLLESLTEKNMKIKSIEDEFLNTIRKLNVANKKEKDYIELWNTPEANIDELEDELEWNRKELNIAISEKHRIFRETDETIIEKENNIKDLEKMMQMARNEVIRLTKRKDLSRAKTKSPNEDLKLLYKLIDENKKIADRTSNIKYKLKNECWAYNCTRPPEESAEGHHVHSKSKFPELKDTQIKPIYCKLHHELAHTDMLTEYPERNRKYT